MNLPIRGYRVPLLVGAVLLGGVAVATADGDVAAQANADRGADEAVGALVAFLQKPEGEDAGRQPDRARGDERERQQHGPERPREGGAAGRFDRPRGEGRRLGPPSAPRFQPPSFGGPRWQPGMAPGAPPQVRAFALQVGPDGVTKGIEVAPPGGPSGPAHEYRSHTVQIDGAQLNIAAVPGPHPDPHAHVMHQLQVILGKLNAIEARLGPPGPHGQPPMGGMPPVLSLPPHVGPHQPGPQAGGPMPPHQPGPQMSGGPGGHQHPPHQPGPGPGGPNPDEINRRFEEHARDLHRHVEEMARGLGEKINGMAGGGEDLRHMHEKVAKTHEQLQDRFQDIRRRFAEQQERIERLEQEVRRLHEAHGVGRAEGKERERKHEEKMKRRDEEKQGAASGTNATSNVSHDAEESARL